MINQIQIPRPVTPPRTANNTVNHQIIVNGHYLGCTDKCQGCHRCVKKEREIRGYTSVTPKKLF
jgi:hypothetical protein